MTGSKGAGYLPGLMVGHAQRRQRRSLMMTTNRGGIYPREAGIYLALWWDMLNVVKGGR